jgi:hypothetical protein
MEFSASLIPPSLFIITVYDYHFCKFSFLRLMSMCCWRRMEKISLTDHVRNEEVLLRVKEQRNILHEVSKRKANWIGHILRRNCLLRQVIEGKIKGRIEVAWRRWRRRRKLLDELKERRGYSHLKEKALYRTIIRARFGRGFGPVVRQTAKCMNVWISITFYHHPVLAPLPTGHFR